MAKKLVLVVEDEPEIQMLLARFLTSLGHVTEIASNATEALSKMECMDFNLVLTDLNMPGMRGDALACEIKRRRQGTPVVLITGSRTHDHSAHFDRVLLKPFSKEQFDETIGSIEGVETGIGRMT